MTNSPLVSYTKISPNKSKRTQKITKITPHYMAGNLTIETCGEVFAPSSRQASSNYGIGSDGRVGMYVPEDYRAWTSSNASNDQQAVTIEVANVDSNGTITQAAWDTLVALCVDICKRNGISKLNFTGDKNGSVTWHCMFSDTSCPGNYLKANTPRLVSEVNAKLSPKVRDRRLQLWAPGLTNRNQQFWARVIEPGNKIALRSVACNEWISDPNSSKSQTPAETWEGTAGNKDPRDPQILILEPADDFGGLFIHPEVAPMLSLDAAGAVAKDGTMVQWYPHNGSLAQVWHFIKINDAWMLLNAATLKALDVPNGGWK